MKELCCAVCGKTKITDLLMFNYGTCLCNSCAEIAAQSFIRDIAERKLKESEKKRKLKESEKKRKLKESEKKRKLKESEKKRKLKESEKKRKASRIAEAAIKFANGTHESLMCNCPGCGKLVPKKDMRLFGRGCYYNDHPTRLCPNYHEKKEPGTGHLGKSARTRKG